jgi:hypothetical protein
MRRDRRGFLAAGAAALGLAPTLGWAAAGAPSYLAAAGLPDGRFALLGLGEDGGERFRLTLPARGHAATAHPRRAEAVAFARRPGFFAMVIDCVEGRAIATLSAPEGRAFQGHGAFTPDGRTLLTTETAEEGRGVIGLWDSTAGYARIGEVSSGGIGPHEILLTPDGARFAVANGGIATDLSSGRTALNSADMAPNLAYLDSATAEIAEVLEAPGPMRRNSIRHIAAGRDGTLAAALQWEGADLETPALLAIHRPGADALEYRSAPENLQRRMRNYAGSVAVSDDGARAAITGPRGGLMLIFDIANGGVEALEAADVCGVAAAPGGFACTTGEGRFIGAAASLEHANLAFDNHLIRIAAS